ncbi:MAG: hypothetical protein WCF90_09900 [Methanomicrobiales archaeon]
MFGPTMPVGILFPSQETDNGLVTGDVRVTREVWGTGKVPVTPIRTMRQIRVSGMSMISCFGLSGYAHYRRTTPDVCQQLTGHAPPGRR